MSRLPVNHMLDNKTRTYCDQDEIYIILFIYRMKVKLK